MMCPCMDFLDQIPGFSIEWNPGMSNCLYLKIDIYVVDGPVLAMQLVSYREPLVRLKLCI